MPAIDVHLRNQETLGTLREAVFDLFVYLFIYQALHPKHQDVGSISAVAGTLNRPPGVQAGAFSTITPALRFRTTGQ